MASDTTQIILTEPNTTGNTRQLRIDECLQIPPVWAAINYLASAVAGVPLTLYKADGSAIERSPIGRLFNRRANTTKSGFWVRRQVMFGALTGGRGLAWIERDGQKPVAIWPLNPSQVTLSESEVNIGELIYTIKRRDGSTMNTLREPDVIDIGWQTSVDPVMTYGPLYASNTILNVYLSAYQQAAKFYGRGGLPLAIMTGNFTTSTAVAQATKDVSAAVESAADDGKPVVAVPASHEIKPLGVTPRETDLVAMLKFLVIEVARMYGLPPVFLESLENSTYSSIEQQDLHLVKHTLNRWFEQWESQLNLKLLPQNSGQYFKFDSTELLRGDVVTRMQAHSTAIASGIYSPAYAAAREQAPIERDADRILVQGGLKPIEDLDKEPAPAMFAAPADNMPTPGTPGNQTMEGDDAASNDE